MSAVKSPKVTTTTKTAIGSPKSAKGAPASPSKRAASEMTTDVKPKKAASAYFIWMNEVGRAEIIAKQFKGDKSKVTEIMKAAGVAWKAMSDADKKKWNEKAEADKLRHAKEMESYVPSESSGPAKKKGKKGKKEKDPNKPKRGMSGYFFYLKEHRDEIIRVDLKGDGKKIAEITKIAGAKWKALDEKAKAPYEAMAAKDRERYTKEMAEYKKNGGGGDDDDDEEDEE